jgi:UDP-2,4-diacetamido-2,4,6-trideoxy-beta-L-altropyranose hydrolase
MRIVLRVDGSHQIGMGHVVRCLALSDRLKDFTDADFLFITKDHKEAKKMIGSKGYKFKSFPISMSEREEIKLIKYQVGKFRADILVTDLLNTTFSENFLLTLKNDLPILNVSIDDLGRKRFYSDIVINGTIVPEWQRYIPTGFKTKFFIGPKYMILRKEFEDAHKKARRIHKHVKNVLIVMGGSDPKDLTIKAINAVNNLSENINATILLGPAYRSHLKLRKVLSKIKQRKMTVIPGVSETSDYLLNSDVIVSSGGLTLYESAATGTPAVVLTEKIHQNKTAGELERRGAVINLGLGEKISEKSITRCLSELMHDVNGRRRMSTNGKKLVDGRGVTRVAKILLGAT